MVDLCEPPKKQRKVSLSGLLGGRIKKEAVTTPEKPELDELEQYLAEPEETDLEIKVAIGVLSELYRSMLW